MTGPPAGWSRTTLGDLAKTVRNGIFASRPTDDPNGVKILRISAVRKGRVGLDDCKYVSGLVDEQIAKFSVSPGDLLFTRYNGSRRLVGICGLVPEHVGPILHPDKLIRVVIPDDRVDARFLNYQMESQGVRGYLEPRIRTTAGQSGIAGADIRGIPVLMPELAEQRRIVDILEDHLSRLDMAGVLLHRIDLRARSLRIAWVDAEMSNWHAPQRNLGTVITDSRTGWDRARSFIVSGAEGHEYLKMNNLTDDGSLDLDSCVRVSGDDAQADRYRLVAGDVLFNNRNSAELVGKTAVADERVAGWTYNNNIVRIRFSPEVLPEFATIQMNSRAFRRRLRQLVSASTNVAAIYTKDLVRLPLVLPDVAVQADFATRYQAMADNATHLRAVCSDADEHAGSLRRALLAAAFSGRLTGRSSDMEMVEEMASV